MTLAVVDTGALYAAVDADDADHGRSVEALEQEGIRLVVPALVIAETTYLIGRRIGAHVEAAFLRGLADFDIEPPSPEDLIRMGELVEQYASFPLGGTDASVIALAERLNTPHIVTLDVRHFGAVRPRHVEAFRIWPQ